MSFLTNLFPMPRYLQMPAVGIDISDRSIKYIELKRAKNKLRLKKFGEIKINPEIIESGVIKKKDKLTEELQKIKHRLENKHIVLSLPEEKAFLKFIELPLMEFGKIRQSIELQLEEIIPLATKDIEFDFELLEKLQTNSNLKIALTAFPKDIINDYAETLTNAGFLPQAFEVESHATARALIPKGEKSACLIIDFGRTRTSFLIASEGVVQFTSTTPIAGESLNKALAKVLKIDIFEAERLKQLQTLNKRADEKILAAIVPIISAIKDEVRRVLNYWENTAGGKREIGKIILCGGESNMKGLSDFFSQELKKPVEMGNAWANVTSFKNYVPEIEKNISLTYTTAIGLALRSFYKNGL